MTCQDCKSWWELCPRCTLIAERKALFFDGLKRAMKRRPEVSPYGDVPYAEWEKAVKKPI